jgi:sigma-B regulation protein RsbU (phosphoserine phosphatase)
MHGYEPLVETRILSSPDQLRNIRDTIREVLRQNNCPLQFIDDFVLAVNEACANIMQHAYKGQCSGDIILEIHRKQNEILVRLTDFAEPVDKTACKPRQLDEIRPGGLGVHFMHELMDEVRFLETETGVGNILQMRKKIITRYQGE